MPDELRAASVLFASLLDERQRRLYAGLESLKCGWGGDTRIAGLLGIDTGTVARGRKQLLTQDIERQRVRRPGGGRLPLEKNARGDRQRIAGTVRIVRVIGSGAPRYIPQTVTGTPAPAGARRKIFSAQVRSGARSNTIRWPASAPQRST